MKIKEFFIRGRKKNSIIEDDEIIEYKEYVEEFLTKELNGYLFRCTNNDEVTVVKKYLADKGISMNRYDYPWEFPYSMPKSYYIFINDKVEIYHKLQGINFTEYGRVVKDKIIFKSKASSIEEFDLMIEEERIKEANIKFYKTIESPKYSLDDFINMNIDIFKTLNKK